MVVHPSCGAATRAVETRDAGEVDGLTADGRCGFESREPRFLQDCVVMPYAGKSNVSGRFMVPYGGNP